MTERKKPIGKGPHLAVRDYFIDYGYEDVMFRTECRTEQVYQKFYGQYEEQLISHTARLFNEALLSGSEITREEYERGKSR